MTQWLKNIHKMFQKSGAEVRSEPEHSDLLYADASLDVLKSLAVRRNSSYRDDTRDIFARISFKYAGEPDTDPLKVLTLALGHDVPEVMYLIKANMIGYLDEWRKHDWSTLKDQYGDSMGEQDQFGVSREELRSHAVNAVQKLVSQYLIDAGAITSCTWEQAGMAAYQAPISIRLSSYRHGDLFMGDARTEHMSKVLFEACWHRLFGGVCCVQADTAVYTKHWSYDAAKSLERQSAREAAETQLALLRLHTQTPSAMTYIREKLVADGTLSYMLQQADSFVSANGLLVSEQKKRMELLTASDEETDAMAKQKALQPVVAHIVEEMDLLASEIDWLNSQLSGVAQNSRKSEALHGRRDHLMTQHLLKAGLLAVCYDKAFFSGSAMTVSQPDEGLFSKIVEKTHSTVFDCNITAIASGITESARQVAVVEHYIMWKNLVAEEPAPLWALVQSLPYAQRLIYEASYLQQIAQGAVPSVAEDILEEALAVPAGAGIPEELRANAKNACSLVADGSVLMLALKGIAECITYEEFLESVRLLQYAVTDAIAGFTLPYELYQLLAKVGDLEHAVRQKDILSFEDAQKQLETQLVGADLTLSGETRSAFEEELKLFYRPLRSTSDFRLLTEKTSMPETALVAMYLQWIGDDVQSQGVNIEEGQMQSLARLMVTLFTMPELSEQLLIQSGRKIGISTDEEAISLLEHMEMFFAEIAEQAVQMLEEKMESLQLEHAQKVELSPMDMLQEYLPVTGDGKQESIADWPK